LYEEAKAVSAEDFDIERRKLKKRELVAKFDEICIENKNDPAKLASIKKSLRKNRGYYFTFMDHK
jgi:hypothetical protein